MKPKVIFVTLGTRGDLYPFIGIARELKRRGNSVKVLTTELYRADCEAAGCEFASILSAQAQSEVLHHPDTWKPLRGLLLYLDRASADTAPAVYEAIAAEAKSGPCVIVYNNIIFGALIACEKLQLPAIAVFLQPYGQLSIDDPARDAPVNEVLLRHAGALGRRLTFAAFNGFINFRLRRLDKMRGALGLPPAGDLMGEWRYSAPLILNLWPEWFCPAKSDWPSQSRRVGFVDYEGTDSAAQNREVPPEVRHFLERRPVVFTMGSEMLQDRDRHAALFKGACQRLGRPGLMFSPTLTSAMFQALSPDFFVVSRLPYAKVFPHASVLVSHGGIGTVARGMSFGKPQLVAPIAFDQFDNGHHVQRLNAGASVPLRSLTAERLAEELDTLCESESVARVCGEISRKLAAENGAARAAEMIFRSHE